MLPVFYSSAPRASALAIGDDAQAEYRGLCGLGTYTYVGTCIALHS